MPVDGSAARPAGPGWAAEESSVGGRRTGAEPRWRDRRPIRMELRRPRPQRPLALAIVLFLGLAACGEDTGQPAADQGAPPADTVADDASAGGYAHPTGADDVVFRYEVGGGFTTREAAFQQLPRLLVSGDGRAFTIGPQVEIYPGPLLPNVQVRTIGEPGIQRLLAAADEAGLLAEITYDDPTDIADAPTTMLTIRADGETWVHAAYALAVDGGPEPGTGESSPDRRRLADFSAMVSDLAAVVDPDQLGEEMAFEPEEYLVTARRIDDVDAFGSDGIEPRVVEWPVDTGIELGEIGDCARVRADDVDVLFSGADQLTFFAEGGTVHQVTPTPVLPGATCPG